MSTLKVSRWLPALLLGALVLPMSAAAQVSLGDAPPAPKDVSSLPGRGPRPKDVTGTFNVNTDSREQTRQFYNAIYPSSLNVPMDSTAVTTNCVPGTNATAFQNATLRRINWFRAMAGIPAAITFDAGESAKDQDAALMMSANNTLQHVGIPPSWSCFTTGGTNAAAHSNLALGSAGADAITGYVWDYGANNYEVGHRRWILYPQTVVMAAGDVPAESGFNAANATWVVDGNYGGSRPATSKPYVAWPPEGFVPYQLVYPQWSLALSNADFSAATVSMKSNGVSIATATQLNTNGYGENTLVWVPMGLDATSQLTTFPFNGTDTVYTVTVTNIGISGGGKIGFTYNVTLFDPNVPGTDYVATIVSGPAKPYLNTSNFFTCTPSANPNTSGYQWLTAQLASGNLVDNANNGLTNFTTSPPPLYPIITNPPVGSGNCFHLCHTNPTSQFLTLKEVLFPATNTTVSFASFLGYATTDESARVQASTDGGINWQDLFVEVGNNGQVDTMFTSRSLSLSNYVGQQTLLRFNYAFTNGHYYPQSDPIAGWCLENIAVTNAQQITAQTTNATATTNFTFTPTQLGNYTLAATPVLFSQFPESWGPGKQITVVTNPVQVIVLGQPVLTNKLVRLNFTITGAAGTFHLLQTTNLAGKWTTNTTATFTTNIPGSSYAYTATNNTPASFFRVQTP